MGETDVHAIRFGIVSKHKILRSTGKYIELPESLFSNFENNTLLLRLNNLLSQQRRSVTS
jgi:hypothetical protein